jgi:hypothetical protein
MNQSEFTSCPQCQRGEACKNYQNILEDQNASLKAEVERLREILAEMVDAFPFLHNLKQTDAVILACKALGRIKEDGRE